MPALRLALLLGAVLTLIGLSADTVAPPFPVRGLRLRGAWDGSENTALESAYRIRLPPFIHHEARE